MTEMNHEGAEKAALEQSLAADGAAKGPNRRVLLLVGGAAVLVAGLGAFFLMSSGGGSGDTGGAVPSAANPTAQPSASPTAKGGNTVPAVYHGKTGRNPFKPLAAEATPAASPSATATATSTSTATSTTGGTTTTSAYQVSPRSVNVAGQTATLWVNGVAYTNVKVGDTFGSVFRLDSVGVSSGKGFVTLTFGDVAEPGKKWVGQTYRFSA